MTDKKETCKERKDVTVEVPLAEIIMVANPDDLPKEVRETMRRINSKK